MNGYDGSVNIDTSLNTSGFSKGMDQMQDIAASKMQKITDQLEKQWKSMDFGQQQQVINKAIGGQSMEQWMNLGAGGQHQAIMGTLADMSGGYDAIAASMEKPITEADQLKQKTQQAAAAGKEFKNIFMGFANIFAAFVPGGYAITRVARGTNDLAAGFSQAQTNGQGLNISLANIGKSLLAIIPVIAIVAAVFAVLAVVAAAFFIKLVNEMSNAVSRTSAYGQQIQALETQFANLKGAWYAAFSPLIAAITPMIITVVNWLTKMLNTIAMITAALLGQKTIMQYIAGSAQTGATATGKLADNTNKAAKAAKGALASFDQINVLQQQSADNADTGGGGGAFQFKEVPIDSGIQDTINKIKDAWGKFTTWIVNAWNTATWIIGEAMKTLVEIFAIVIELIVVAISNLVQKIVYFFTVIVPEAWNTLSMLIQLFVIGLELYWQQMKDSFIAAWNGIVAFWNGIGPWFSSAWNSISTWATNAWVNIVATWNGAAAWFQTTIIDPLGKAFQTMLDGGDGKGGIKGAFTTVFTGIKDFIKTTINSIITFINGMISAIVSGINSVIGSIDSFSYTVPPWVPGFAGDTWGFNIPKVSAIKIPLLAQGAVIPPNAAFAAVLGDQSSGKNLEGPEDLFRQIVRDEIQNNPQRVETTIKFAGNMATLIQVLKPYIDQENVRIGPSFIQSSGSAS